MILPAAALQPPKRKIKKTGRIITVDSEVSESDYDSDESIEGMASSSDENEENLDPEVLATIDLKKCWKNLCPPVVDSDIKGKWVAVIYNTKKRSMLLIGKILKRFLVEKDGDVDCFEIKFLKPKVGSGNILEDTPKHLPDDISSDIQYYL